MPIVTGTPKVTIEIDGKVDDLIKDINRVEKELDDFAAANKRVEQQVNNLAERPAMNWTEFRSMYSTVLDVVRVGQQVWAATGQEYVNYGDEVAKVTRLTGLQATEASRLIQVADDLFISQEALNGSLKIAAKNYDVSINGLAKMADEYKALGTAQEKAKFASERFGRNYTEIVKLLEQGGDTIKQMAANQPEGLILNDNDLQKIKEYKQSVDQLNDSFTAVKMNIGRGLVPVLTDVTDGVNLHTRALEIMEEKGLSTYHAMNQVGYQAALAQAAAEQKAARAIKDEAQAAGEAEDDNYGLADSQKTAEEAAKRLSATLQGMLSNMFAIQGQTDRYNESLDQLNQKDKELADQKQKATYAWYQEQAAGNATNETYGRYMQQLADITKAEQENAAAKTKLSADQDKADKQRLYNMVQQKLAADGLITSPEFEFLQNLAVQKGLVSKATADQAIAENKLADDMVANFERVKSPMDNTLTTMQQIAAFNGQTVSFQVAFSVLAGMGGTFNPAGYTVPQNNLNFAGAGGLGPRAEGGPVYAGRGYIVGERGPELFIPGQSGTIAPNAGSNITINIASIANRGDIDYLAQEVQRRITR